MVDRAGYELRRTAGLLMPARKHSHMNGSAPELARRGAVGDIEVQTPFAYSGAGVKDPVRAVVRRGSRDANARSQRQDRRIGCDDTFRDREARRSDPTGAVRSRRKQYSCSGTFRSLRCRHLRWRHLRRWYFGRRYLGWRYVGWRSRVNAMGTCGYGQEQRHEPRLPSTRCDKPIHGLGLPQTAIRRPRTAKFAGMSNSTVDAEFPVDRFRRPITKFCLARIRGQGFDARASWVSCDDPGSRRLGSMGE